MNKTNSKQRTCVICKTKRHKDELYRFFILNGEIVIDLKHKINSFGYYFCLEHTDYESDLKKFITKKSKGGRSKDKVESRKAKGETPHSTPPSTLNTQNSINTLLQLAFKANKLILGHDILLREMARGRVKMVLLAEDLSQNSLSSITRETEKSKTLTINFGNKDLYYNLFGKYVGIIGITDENFKNGIIKVLSVESGVLREKTHHSKLTTQLNSQTSTPTQEATCQ